MPTCKFSLIGFFLKKKNLICKLKLSLFFNYSSFEESFRHNNSWSVKLVRIAEM